MYGREKERSRTNDVQMDALRGLLGIRRIDCTPNEVVERSDKIIVLWWFTHSERILKSMIIKGECIGSCPVG